MLAFCESEDVAGYQNHREYFGKYHNSRHVCVRTLATPVRFTMNKKEGLP